MIQLIKRWYAQFIMRMTMGFNANADPEVEFEQAAIESGRRHNRVREAAINSIAGSNRAQLQLNNQISSYEKTTGLLHTTVRLIEKAEKAGNVAEVARLNTAAITLTNQLIQQEMQIESQKALVLASVASAEDAKEMVAGSALTHQQILDKRFEGLTKLSQAKMVEARNASNALLREAVAGEVPTVSQVMEKIEARYAKAMAGSELDDASVEGTMRMIERTSSNDAAVDRLALVREQLSITSGQAPKEVK